MSERLKALFSQYWSEAALELARITSQSTSANSLWRLR